MEFGHEFDTEKEYENFVHRRNHYIMSLPQKEFDRLCNYIIPDIDTSSYVGD